MTDENTTSYTAWWDSQPMWLKLMQAAGTAISAYHGYKRTNSVGWAIGWGFLGGVFPYFTVPVAIAQGFGEPETHKATAGLGRYRGRGKRMSIFGAWKSPKTTTYRKRLLKSGRSDCFLDPKGVGATPGRPRYFVCNGSGKVSCEGLLAARRRTILVGEQKFEKKAISQGKLMGCSWAKNSISKYRAGRKGLKRSMRRTA